MGLGSGGRQLWYRRTAHALCLIVGPGGGANHSRQALLFFEGGSARVSQSIAAVAIRFWLSAG